MQKLLGMMRRAITDYKMIENGDHIVVGISGGKDSIALLTALKTYQRFSPEQFTLTAITIDLGLKDTSQVEIEALKAYISALDVDYQIVKTDIAPIIFDKRKENNPCSLCSNMRRGALNNKAIEIKANKLALGHHADDVLQTLFLSLMYEGRFYTFSPKAYLDKSGITQIRPFIYVEESYINKLSKKLNFPIVHNPCPANKHTKREDVNNLIKLIEKDFPLSKNNMLSAIYHPERNKLWDKTSK